MDAVLDETFSVDLHSHPALKALDVLSSLRAISEDGGFVFESCRAVSSNTEP